nr:MAG TPA: hypothetical protein [Caudoviricetes sp.]DAQ19403.1 MAG TPA: hypothetical protein [Caudoviricetes sp.]
MSSIFRIHSNHCCHFKKILYLLQKNSILHEASTSSRIFLHPILKHSSSMIF